MIFQCLNCRQSLEVDNDQGGNTILCPSCGNKTLVPKNLPMEDDRLVTSSLNKSANGSEPINVRIVDVRMPFSSMVVFILKWTLAAIPAGIIVFLFYLFVTAIVIQGCVGPIR